VSKIFGNDAFSIRKRIVTSVALILLLSSGLKELKVPDYLIARVAAAAERCPTCQRR
jgi:hypothetical protein